MPNTGIDTVQLRLHSLEVTGNADIYVKQTDFNPTTGACKNEERTLFHIGANAVQGVRAYSNFNDIFFDCKFFPKIDYAVSFVRFSVPSKCSGGKNNVSCLDEKATYETFQKVESDLSDHGIYTDLSKATFSRLDLFRNITLNKDLANYQNVLSCLHASRKRRRDFGGFGYLWENTVEEFNAYDKKGEQEKKKNELPYHLKDVKNLTRFEHRMLRGRTIINRLKIENPTVKKILEKYEVLNKTYTSRFKDHVFKVKPNQMYFNEVEYLPAIISMIQEMYPSRWVYYLKLHLGCVKLSELVPDKKKLLDIFAQSCNNRMQLHRVGKEIDKIMVALDWPKYKRKDIRELYSELKRKVTKL